MLQGSTVLVARVYTNHHFIEYRAFAGFRCYKCGARNEEIDYSPCEYVRIILQEDKMTTISWKDIIESHTAYLDKNGMPEDMYVDPAEVDYDSKENQ